MPSPIVHSQQGLGIAGLMIKFLLPTFSSLGIEGLLPVAIGLVGYISHMPLDCIPHADTVVYGSEEDFERSMAWDPKKEAHDIGLWPVYTPGSRQMLRATHPRVADPQPVDITRRPMMWALADVAVAAIITSLCLWPYLGQPFFLACLAAGAFGTVAPDLVLAKPIHSRAIRNNLFWLFDYLHHWLHAPVMLRKDRVAGTLIQVFLFILFGWFAWANRP